MESLKMSYSITLKHGAFFFAGKIGVAGNGSTVTIEESDLDNYTIKAINSAQLSGIIETDVPILLEDTFQADILVESEVTEVAEEKEEEETVDESLPSIETVSIDEKIGKKNKRG
jgi:hypothetical protein